MLARVKSVLRRASSVALADFGGPKVAMGRRVLDLERRLLLDTDGAEERLAPGEFNLLKLFVENPNRPLARDWLLEVTSHREAEAFDRAIDLRIARLRRKIERDSTPSRGDPYRPRRRLYVRAQRDVTEGGRGQTSRQWTSVNGGSALSCGSNTASTVAPIVTVCLGSPNRLPTMRMSP